MRLFFLLCVFTLVLASGAEAKRYKFEGASGGIQASLWQKNHHGVQFTYDGELMLDALLNEPIVGLKARWKVSDTSMISVPVGMEGGKWKFREGRVRDLGPEAAAKIALIGVKLEFAFSHPDIRDKVYLTADVGVMAKGDGSSWSYNTPGSPDWSKLLYRGSKAFGSGPQFLTEAQAKKLWRLGLQIEDVYMIERTISLHDLQNWYWKAAGSAETAALETSIRAMSESIYRAYGYSAVAPSEIESRFASLRREYLGVTEGLPNLSSLQAYRDKLAELDKKLKSLPEELTDSLRKDVYADIVRDADADLREIKTLSFASLETDPSTIPPGLEFVEPKRGYESFKGANGFYGYRERGDGAVVIEAKYQYTIPQGHQVVAEYAVPEGDGLFPVCDGNGPHRGKCMYLDLDGKVALSDSIWRDVYPFINGHAKVDSSIINNSGKIAFKLVNSMIRSGDAVQKYDYENYIVSYSNFPYITVTPFNRYFEEVPGDDIIKVDGIDTGHVVRSMVDGGDFYGHTPLDEDKWLFCQSATNDMDQWRVHLVDQKADFSVIASFGAHVRDFDLRRRNPCYDSGFVAKAKERLGLEAD